ncbi:iron ABC transporter permease [Alicyclobacillus fastidiosus]|uniref:Iron ABC transporter permease n=2 Tax=Alicyclobacillus fastidiosus TaxID=392011 RepID=A0ABV5ALF0_9BACL|nr:iron ABC transporter permease [Alicyclobacillus fastidiosus]WEH11063.1 iron ABC transporter permease [Alicyclobacillus fastidiosus]
MTRFIRYPKNSIVTTVTVCFLLLVCVGFVGLMVGAPFLQPVQLWAIFTNSDNTVNHVLVMQSRLPRFILGSLAGAMLSVSGVMLQNVMRNALADPELLGVSSGSAAVMAAIIIFQLPISYAWQPWLALLGGVIGGGFVVLASWRDKSTVRVILIGVAVSSLLNAIITTIVSLGQQDTISLFYDYFVGGLENRTWRQVELILPWVVVLCVSYLFARQLNILQLGDELSAGLGLKVSVLRLIIFLLAIALVAPVVATCGPISYIAMLAPHITRHLLRTQDTLRIIPVSMLVGAVLLTFADFLARTLFSPIEIPVGVWTTLLGGPLLLLFLGRRFGRERA